MASEPGVEIRGNEVLLVKDGHPVLKVERGTPLSLVKLLYEADPRHSGHVIGLRPYTNDPLPCFVTLDETALVHAKYDVIVHAHGSTKATKNESIKQDLPGLPRPQLQEAAVNTDSSGISPQLVSEGSGQVDTSSSQDFTLSLDVSEDHNFHVTAPAEHSVSSRPKHRAVVVEETRKQPRFQERYYGSGITAPLRKRPLSSMQATSSPSHRRKNARKLFPRKITMMVPNTSQGAPAGVQVQSFSFPFMQSSATQSNHRTEGGVAILSTAAENIDSSAGLCDSTAGGQENLRALHENGNFTEDESEHNSPAADAFRPSLQNAFSAAEDGRFLNSNCWESSSTNDSSPAISEEQPAIVDVNSENSSTELDQDGSGVLSECSTVPYQFERNRTNSCGDVNESMSVVSLREPNTFSREPSETAVVTLENTVEVKAEPALDVIADDLGTNEEEPTQTHTQNHPSSRKSGKTNEQTDRVLPGTSSATSSATVAREENMDNNTCNVCNKQFETMASLYRHKRTHSGERPFICSICGWGFNLSGNLNQHMAIHQKVKPFRCPFCGKTFARSNVLKAHVRCHTGERPYQCHVCGSNFVISHNLKKHLLIRHGIQGKLDRGESVGSHSQSDQPGDKHPDHTVT